ncbi:DUF2971 domain-containing protein [Promicromonospora alba]|uniref:DUF2971 domain-containing protein n=1 Tax=Promicromonospora alba TaxID=1616110 RepID=A0ABV9HIQ1_9MICO
MPLPPHVLNLIEVKTPVVYHYTDAAGLLGVAGDNELWATESHGMNDKAEVHQGWRFIEQWLSAQDQNDLLVGELKTALGWAANGWASSDIWGRAYFLCASVVQDDANQWRNYGDAARGFSIAFDATVPLGVVTGEPGPSEPEADTGGHEVARAHTKLIECVSVFPWSRVLYAANDKNAVLEAYLAGSRERAHRARNAECGSGRDLRLSEYATDFEVLAKLMKSPGFEGEHEVRLIVSSYSQRHASFRAGRYGIVTFQRLVRRMDDRAGLRYGVAVGKSGTTLPITQIMTGPLVDYEHNRIAIEALLERHGHEGVTIEFSKLLMR